LTSTDRPIETSAALRELEHLVKTLPACPQGFKRGIDVYSFSELVPVLNNAIDMFMAGNGHPPSLLNPLTFTEKVFASKFLTPFALPTLADKVLAHHFVSKLAGKQFVPKQLFVTHSARKAVARFAKCPPGRFVLKANNGCGDVRFSINPGESLEQTVEAMERRMAIPFGRSWGEWHYSTIEPLYLIEERLPAPAGAQAPFDYRFYCFEGKVELIHVDVGRKVNHVRTVYTRDFEFLPDVLIVRTQGLPVEKPAAFTVMRDLAETIARAVPHPFCRMDLYFDERFGVKFSEITLTPGNAYQPISDRGLSLRLGEKFRVSP
jgi:hypothetical protein